MRGCIFKQRSAVAGRTPGRCPRPRRGGCVPPRTPPAADEAWLHFQATLRSREKNAGALPQTPPAADEAWLRFHATFHSRGKDESIPLPGRPALPARLCASAQGKGWEFSEKQAHLFSRKSPAFSFARELSCRPRKHQARIVCFSKWRSIAKTGPGPGGSWFGGPGAEEAPGCLRDSACFAHNLPGWARCGCFCRPSSPPRRRRGYSCGCTGRT